MNNRIGFFWVIANTIGAALGYFIGFNLANNFGPPGLFTPNKAVFCVFIGATIGLAQWLVLLRHIRANLLWILATTVGWSLGFGTNHLILFIVTLFLSSIINSVVILPICFAISCILWGLLVGALQWLILVFQVRKAYRWLLINLWAISASLSVAGFGIYSPYFSRFDIVTESFSRSFYMGLFGLSYGCITAGVLVKLLQHPRD